MNSLSNLEILTIEELSAVKGGADGIAISPAGTVLQ